MNLTPTGSRAREALHRITPVEAGVAAFGLVAITFGAWLAVLVVLLAWGGFELWHRHRQHRAAMSIQGRLPRGLVELVLGAVLLRRDGVLGSMAWGIIVVAVVGLVALVVVGLIVSAAHGLALLAGIVAAGAALVRDLAARRARRTA